MGVFNTIVVILVLLVTVFVVGTIMVNKIESDEDLWIFTKTGREYFVEGEVKMKNPTTGEWVPGILYHAKDTGEVFVKEYSDFVTHFEHKKDKKDGK